MVVREQVSNAGNKRPAALQPLNQPQTGKQQQ